MITQFCIRKQAKRGVGDERERTANGKEEEEAWDLGELEKGKDLI